MLVTSLGEVQVEQLQWVRETLRGPVGAYVDVTMPTTDEQRAADAAALDLLLGHTTLDILLLDRARMHAMWTQRDDPAAPAVVHDPTDGEVAFESELHRDLVQLGRGLELLAPPDTQPAVMAGAATIAGTLRTDYLGDNQKPPTLMRVKCLGVAPLVPLPPYCTQEPDSTHQARLHFIRRCLATNLTLDRSVVLGDNTLDISTFEGRYLGWLNFSNE